jgi:peptidoglycan/LPS O-acetylase OafA/YrhL
MAQASEKRSFKDTSASVLLDLMRGLAALLVLLGHWRNLVFVDFPKVASHRLLLSLPYAITSAQHQAVIIFFVLSGYLIAGSVHRSFARDGWNWTNYLIHRLVRLWIVLIPGLLLCLLWDLTGTALHLAPTLYSGQVLNGFIADVSPRLAPQIFLGNLFFLQNILVPAFGSDGPLWSLANEFWYYLFFPLGIIAVRRSSAPVQRVISGVLFLAIAWFVGRGILLLFPVWLAGAALALIRRRRLGNGSRIFAAFVYTPLPFIFAKLHGIPSLLSDYLFSAVTFAFLLVLLSAVGPADPQSFFTRFSRALARFSYTLYVVHLPFILCLTALILGVQRFVPDIAHVAAGLAILVVSLAYAWLIASATEFHTDQVRHWIEARIRRPEVLPRQSKTG